MKSKTLKLILKLLLTGGAIFLVVSKIDTEMTWRVIREASIPWLLLSLLFYAASKVFCAFRLNGYFRDVGLRLAEWQNVKLYAIGMFYNLFLPGGIGGDGYKVYLLNRTHQIRVKPLLQAVLLDRGNGLAVLVLLLFLLYPLVPVSLEISVSPLVIGAAGGVLTVGVFYVVMLLFFRDFMPSLQITTLYSFLNQILQLVGAYCIMKSIGINDGVFSYMLVFLVSSIVSVLPLTIGGVGARELVFVLAHDYVGIDKNAAVAFSVLFFITAALTSLSGVFFSFEGGKVSGHEVKTEGLSAK